MNFMVLIVFEGLDASGKETQTKLLKEWLDKKKKKSIIIQSPNKKTPVGQAYEKYLYEEFKMERDAVFLICACDVIINKPIIEKAEQENKIVIADRYITSTIAYQGANGFSFDKSLKIVETMEFPKADVIIYINISPEISIKRKEKEKEILDKHEKDLKFLTKVGEFYVKEMEQNVLGKWFVVDGEKSKEEVRDQIVKIIGDVLNLN